jgi:hypothetical protein
MDDNQIRYLPFNAINEFMLDEFRHKVIHTVMRDVEKLPGDRRGSLNGMVRKYISLPGFRNSTLAPLPMRVKNAIQPFERRPEFTARVLQCWSDLHVELRQQIFDMLVSRGWEKLLPPEADRSKLPGFQAEWPKTETYDALDQSYAELYPEGGAVSDDIRLMAVWIANRLPYELFEDEEGEEAGNEEETA